MKTLLKIKFELLITPLFILLFILDLYFIGINGLKEKIFTFIIFLEIPMCYVGIKIIRNMFYKVFIGSKDYED